MRLFERLAAKQEYDLHDDVCQDDGYRADADSHAKWLAHACHSLFAEELDW
jgi:hypothetical protein